MSFAPKRRETFAQPQKASNFVIPASTSVIPAQAGIQYFVIPEFFCRESSLFNSFLDSGIHRYDKKRSCAKLSKGRRISYRKQKRAVAHR